MIATPAARWVVVVGALAVAPQALPGQTIADRVAAVGTGTVRLSYDTRDGVCGDGNGMTVTNRRSLGDWEPYCEGGPIRVSLRVRDGSVTSLDTHVGGRWRQRDGVVDLGTIAPADAAAFFLTLARTARGSVAEDAVMPAAVARGVSVWRELAAIARDADRPDAVRKSALFWIGQDDDPEIVPVLSGFIESGEEEIAKRAVFALAQQRTAPAYEVLRALARDEGRRLAVRESAIFWLGQRGPDSGTFLRDLYDEIGDGHLRERIIFSVSQRRNEESRDWLFGIALDETESMQSRERAIFWLGQRRDAGSRYVDLYDRIDDPELRERLIFGFSRQGADDVALEKLMAIASDSTADSLRERALFWLGQSRDPRAVAFLERLIFR